MGQRGDRGVDGDERRDEGDDRHRQHDDPGAVVSDAGDQRLADERRHTGRFERLADHEERSDEEDGRVAETRQRLLQVEHARRPQRECGPDRHDRDGDPVPDEDDHAPVGGRRDGRRLDWRNRRRCVRSARGEDTQDEGPVRHAGQ